MQREHSSSRRTAVLAVLCVAATSMLAGCATSPLGRKQLILLPDSQLDAMGAQAFADISQQMKSSDDPEHNGYVACVAKAVILGLEPPDDRRSWELRVFQDPTPNAFALPGGKIGVHTGLLEVAKSQDQLASVLGHEIGHVLARHSNERMSQQAALQLGIATASIALDSADPEYAKYAGLLGVGAQLGIILPYSRKHESEADLIGLDLMARAGFDPRESVALWQNMASAGGGQPPEFLSSHPSHETRISDLEARMDHALALSREARAAGIAPDCRR